MVDFELLRSLPALLKIALFFLCWIIAWLPIAIPIALAVKWRPGQPFSFQQKLPLLASLYLLAPLILWGETVLQNQSFAAYGLPLQGQVLVSLVWGLGVGAIGLGIVFGLQAGLGWLRWQTPPGPIGFPLLLTGLLGLWVGFTEELIFRGYLLTQLQADYPLWVAAGLSSAIFALLHLVWEGRNTLPQLPGLWLMGFVLVLARWMDGGNLGLAWGLHAGWVWLLASLDATQTIAYTGKAPSWLTGLDDQPLAGAIGIGFLLLMGAGLVMVQRVTG